MVGKVADLKQIKDPVFWEKAWRKDRENSLFRRGRKTLKDTVNFWNRRADNFQKNVMGEKGDKRVNRVLRWLEKQGVELTGKRVLDIGAGPGAFTLAMAQRCREVVALEPAEVMVEYLNAEIKSSALQNVRVIQETWEEVDLEREGLKGAFDLVFASMSPGINNLETIEKAFACSKGYFYYSSFAGRRESELMPKLWRLLYGEELPPWPDQSIFVLNLLYALGHQLTFEVWEERSSLELSPQRATAIILEELHIYGKEPPYPEDKLADFINTHTREGWRQESVTRLGQILAKIKK